MLSVLPTVVNGPEAGRIRISIPVPFDFAQTELRGNDTGWRGQAHPNAPDSSASIGDAVVIGSEQWHHAHHRRLSAKAGYRQRHIVANRRSARKSLGPPGREPLSRVRQTKPMCRGGKYKLTAFPEESYDDNSGLHDLENKANARWRAGGWWCRRGLPRGRGLRRRSAGAKTLASRPGHWYPVPFVR